MNRKYKMLFLFVLVSNTILACDLCSVYIGIQPQDFKSSFGLRYRYRLFESKYTLTSVNNTYKATPTARLASSNGATINHGDEHVTGVSENETYLYAEQYNSVDVVLNLFFGKKFSLLLSNSFSDNYVYRKDSLIDNVSGFGDLSVIANYRLINTKVSSDSLAKNKLMHRLTVGAGVELPTGSYTKQSVVGYETTFSPSTIIGKPKFELDPHLQAGTGSFNYIIMLEYLVKINRLGLNTNLSYKMFTENSNHFQFANRYNYNSSLFYLIKFNEKVKMLPYLGVNYEMSYYDNNNGLDLLDSGGEALFLSGGINFFIRNVGIDLTYFNPIYQNLFGAQPSNKTRIIAQLTYYF